MIKKKETKDEIFIFEIYLLVDEFFAGFFSLLNNSIPVMMLLAWIDKITLGVRR